MSLSEQRIREPVRVLVMSYTGRSNDYYPHEHALNAFLGPRLSTAIGPSVLHGSIATPFELGLASTSRKPGIRRKLL